MIPDLSNPQSLNRYSYVRNNPILFNDPTGHMETCGEDDYCQHASSTAVKNLTYQKECAEGKNKACPGGTQGAVAFAVTSIVTAGLSEYGLLEGAAAGAIEALPNLAENGFRQIAVMCLKNPLCARLIGASGGVTVLGKIIQGEEPPSYVKIAQEVNGRSLYVDNFNRTIQDQFWNETKSLGNPVLLANDYTKYPGSTFFNEVTDLMDSGWTIILKVLAYPPKQ